MILECHSRGDRRFSALYARLPDGKTIEETYQEAKRDEDGFSYASPKGKRAFFFQIGEKCIPTTLHVQHDFYLLLWKWYFDHHVDVFLYASYFEEFRDVFDGRRGFIYRLPLSRYPMPGGYRCAQSQAIAWLVQHDNQPSFCDVIQEFSEKH